MNELYNDFKRRNAKLRDAGFGVEVMWECDWKKKKQEVDVKQFLADLDLQPPLNPRASFYGGRTNATYLHYIAAPGEEIRYYDFTSLYPFVNKNKLYPTGHPRILLQHDIDINRMDQYFGIVKCSILPPTDLYHPILPYRFRDKCMFVLCRTCAEEALPPSCTHTDAERALSGTWTTVDINLALDNGYQMVSCSEIWQYDDSSDTLFTSYMNRFLANKMHAGDYPAHCDTPEKKAKYIEDIAWVEGVELEDSKMLKNPSMYNVSKLNLNTLWGKFGQRENLGKTKLVNDEETFWRLLFSNQCQISSIVFFGERYAQITYKDNEEVTSPGLYTNVAIAAFTTAHARLHLWQYLDRLGDRVLYFDTDSIIFVHRPGRYCPPTGDFLGEFKDEFKPGQYAVEFVGAGPKNYGVQLNTGESWIKVRGFTSEYFGPAVLELWGGPADYEEPDFSTNDYGGDGGHYQATQVRLDFAHC